MAADADGFRQPLAPRQPGLPRRRGGQRGGAARAGSTRRAIDGHHLPLRRPRGRHRSAASPTAWTRSRQSGSTRCARRSATGSMSSSSATAGHQEAVNEPQLIDYAYRRGVPLVATNEPFFPGAGDFEAHDALLAIAGSTVLAQTERRKLTAEHYFKSRKEMEELFADLPEALNSTVEIAQRASYRPKTRGPILPRFAAQPGPERGRGHGRRGRGAAGRGARGARAAAASGSASSRASPRQDYDARLEFELGVIIKMKYPGYFLIVADFIQWAKARDIPVGPGRGSGAGSLVAYSLTITDLDPLRYDLLFERFLNPDRVSMPDFDIDFCQDRAAGGHRLRPAEVRPRQRRPDHHLRNAAGPRRAARRRPRAADALWPGRPADQAGAGQPRQPGDAGAGARDRAAAQACCATPTRPVAQLIQIAMKLEGLYRHASTHAAGIVIGERPLTELVPMYRDPRSDMPVTQYSLKWVEPAGLVKFDFLGLKTLTTLDIAAKMINRNGTKFDLADIPIDDETDLRDAGAGRRGRRVPGGIRRHAAGAGRHAARPLRGPHRARRALPAGPDGQHPDLLRPQGRARAGRVSPPACSSRSSRRPTASSPTRSRCSRSPGRSPAIPSPRPTSSAAPWARRSRRRWHAQRDRFLAGADRARDRRRARLDHLRCLREIRRVRVQQVPLGALRLHHVPDGLPQGAPRPGVHRGVDDARHGQHRQARRIPRATPRSTASRSCRPTSTGPKRRSRRATARSSTPSAPSRASARRSPSTSSRRAATGRSPTSPISPRGSIRGSSTGGRSRR